MKSLSSITLLATVGVALSAPVLAQEAKGPANVQELVAAVEATYAGVNSLSAEFTQSTKSSAFEATMSGTVSMERPRKVRWDTTGSAGGSLVVSDGAKLWMYMPEQKQVMVYQDLSGTASGAMAMDILSDMTKLDETFATEMGAGDADSYTVVLKPKAGAESNYSTIVLDVTKDAYVLEKVVLTDLFGTVTTYDFKNLKLNPELDDATFTFKAPEGVTVMDASQI